MLRLLTAVPLIFLTNPALARDAGQADPVPSVQNQPTAQATAATQPPVWPMDSSDLPVDPAYRFGILDNGLRYIIRPNGTPAAQGMVQFWIEGGSIDETEAERGYAHFVEHMAFNGSTRVPEGEMIHLLERQGLAFGADTNASTSFDTTLYKLDLPRNDPALLDTALMLMREVASELLFDPAAVEREKGVVLSEMRVRDSYAMDNTVERMKFLFPTALFPDRLPIGKAETLQAATADSLRALWQRLYRPGNSALIVVGDYDPDLVEAAIRTHFSSWQADPPLPPVSEGPIDVDLAGKTDIFLHPALSERLTITRHGEWIGEPDSLAYRQRNVRRQIGYGIINRRLQSMAREDDPPFRGAGLGSSEAFQIGRSTNLVIDAGEGEWKRGLAAAQAEYRRALAFGFTEAEVAEQLANLRSALENNVAGTDTRGNASFITGALTLLEDGQIPTTPASGLARFEDHVPLITPQSVLESLQEELIPLDNPLIRFEGRTAPEGGADALRAAWNAGMEIQPTRGDRAETAAFAYDDFGAAGTVVSDQVDPRYGIRKLVFANGLMLNLKRTDLQRGRVAVELNVDGGQMLNTREQPLATAMASVLPMGGLGRHSNDELQSVLAGRTVGFNFETDERSFRLAAQTTPRDLQLQLQLLAAALTDPGYRPQGEAQYRRNIRNVFARRTATPDNALSASLGEIVSDGDPRFTRPEADAYLALNFEQLRKVISDRLDHGALELALVGDMDETAVIAAVASTLGALPSREASFRPYTENRDRSFTADRSPRTLYHDGTAQQALVRMSWPTTDDSDLRTMVTLNLLERIVRLELTAKLREELGQTYSPGVSSTQSSTYRGYGLFTIAAAVDVAQVAAAREAMLETIAATIAGPLDEDLLLRARAPLLERYDSALKTNGGWLSITRRAQGRPEVIDRFSQARDILAGLSLDDVKAVAARFLDTQSQLEVDVLPRAKTAETGE